MKNTTIIFIILFAYVIFAALIILFFINYLYLLTIPAIVAIVGVLINIIKKK